MVKVYLEAIRGSESSHFGHRECQDRRAIWGYLLDLREHPDGNHWTVGPDLAFICVGLSDKLRSIEGDIPSHVECHFSPQWRCRHTLSLYAESKLSSRAVGESESSLRFLCLVFSSDATDLQIRCSRPVEFSHFLKQVFS